MFKHVAIPLSVALFATLGACQRDNQATDKTNDRADPNRNAPDVNAPVNRNYYSATPGPDHPTPATPLPGAATNEDPSANNTGGRNGVGGSPASNLAANNTGGNLGRGGAGPHGSASDTANLLNDRTDQAGRGGRANTTNANNNTGGRSTKNSNDTANNNNNNGGRSTKNLHNNHSGGRPSGVTESSRETSTGGNGTGGVIGTGLPAGADTTTRSSGR